MEVRSGILNIEYRLEKAKEYGIFHWENREYGIFHIPREGTEHIQFDCCYNEIALSNQADIEILINEKADLGAQEPWVDFYTHKCDHNPLRIM